MVKSKTKAYRRAYYLEHREKLLLKSKLANRPKGGLKCIICGDDIPIEMSSNTKFCDACINGKKTNRAARWYRKHKTQISKVRKNKNKKGVVK